MIATQPKPLDEVLKYLEPHGRIFLVGCGGCATVCKTGGEVEVAGYAGVLGENGKEITAQVVPQRTCYIHHVAETLGSRMDTLRESDAVVVLGCGGAVQVVRIFTELKDMIMPVYTALDTIGHMDTLEPDAFFYEECSECGSCMLNETGGICPMTLCAKGLVNGPCGGAKDGKCEVDRNRDCAWELIYHRLRALGRLDEFRRIRPPRDYSKAAKPRSLRIAPPA